MQRVSACAVPDSGGSLWRWPRHIYSRRGVQFAANFGSVSPRALALNLNAHGVDERTEQSLFAALNDVCSRCDIVLPDCSDGILRGTWFQRASASLPRPRTSTVIDIVVLAFAFVVFFSFEIPLMVFIASLLDLISTPREQRQPYTPPLSSSALVAMCTVTVAVVIATTVFLLYRRWNDETRALALKMENAAVTAEALPRLRDALGGTADALHARGIIANIAALELRERNSDLDAQATACGGCLIQLHRLTGIIPVLIMTRTDASLPSQKHDGVVTVAQAPDMHVQLARRHRFNSRARMLLQLLATLIFIGVATSFVTILFTTGNRAFIIAVGLLGVLGMLQLAQCCVLAVGECASTAAAVAGAEAEVTAAPGMMSMEIHHGPSVV